MTIAKNFFFQMFSFSHFQKQLFCQSKFFLHLLSYFFLIIFLLIQSLKFISAETINYQTCPLDKGPAKTVASICVGDCPKRQTNSFCWPVEGNLGQFPFNPTGSHANGDAFDINGNGGATIYAPVSGDYTFGTAPQVGTWKYNNGMPGCYATVKFEYNGEELQFRFAHMPYENNVAPGAAGGKCKTGTYYYNQGDPIGVVNSTGNSSGNHLHFAIIPANKGQSRFPELFFQGVAATRENKDNLTTIVNQILCKQ